VTKVQQIRARHVIWCTVPHVTIAPVARGVASKVAPGSRYFPYKHTHGCLHQTGHQLKRARRPF
jgi:hypothetical protein